MEQSACVRAFHVMHPAEPLAEVKVAGVVNKMLTGECTESDTMNASEQPFFKEREEERLHTASHCGGVCSSGIVLFVEQLGLY